MLGIKDFGERMEAKGGLRVTDSGAGVFIIGQWHGKGRAAEFSLGMHIQNKLLQVC
jgi:hypothetical protein